MRLWGRFRAALGRDDASLLARARGDVKMGLALNPPACHAPLNRAIAALERLPNSPEVALLLGRALRARAQTLTGKPARDLRVRAVAKLRAAIEQPRIAAAERAALWAALAQAWLPLPEDEVEPELSYRQLLRAQEAQSEALVIPTAESHLAMAEICFALCLSSLSPDSRSLTVAVQYHLHTARELEPDADQLGRLEALESALHLRIKSMSSGGKS